MIKLNPDFKKFLKLFQTAGVEYLVVGGFAVIHHGYIRTTEDIDLWIAQTPENAQRIISVLTQLGFTKQEVPAKLFLNEHQITRMGVKPFRIEILTTISGIDFDDCFSRKKTWNYDGMEIPFISLDDLLINKKASGRPKDLIDLENLPGHEPAPTRRKTPRTRKPNRPRR